MCTHIPATGVYAFLLRLGWSLGGFIRGNGSKSLQVPDDVQLGDCWLLGADKLKKYKLVTE